MRIFEVILILVNLIFLILVNQNQKHKQKKGTFLVGINLFVLIIHGITEGFRYQMTFSYIFVVSIIICTLLKKHNKLPKLRSLKLLKVVIICLAVLLLIFESIIAYALPVFKIDEPTGDFEVGIKYLNLVDENRIEPFKAESDEKREIMVKIYYPAVSDNSKVYSSYFNNSDELLEVFADFYHMPKFIFSHLKLVKLNSKDNLLIADQQENYPVILFSHGAGTSMEVQTSQCEDLASNGYIVVAIDHTYVSAGTVFDERTVNHMDATTDFDVVEPAEIITEIMSQDCKFVLDELEKMNNYEKESLFYGRLNVDKIGIIGHSVGGATAYNMAINDSRIKAAINLDGVVFTKPEDKNIAPLLMIANDNYHVQAIQNKKPLMENIEEMAEELQEDLISFYGNKSDYEETYNRAKENIESLSDILKESGNLFTIEGSEHMSYTDLGLFIGIKPIRKLLGLSGETSPEKCLEITKALSVEFFDENLKENSNNSLDLLLDKYTELKRIR